MRFLKKEKDTYIYDGHISPDLIRWYADNVKSEKMPYDECDVNVLLNQIGISCEQLFWVEVASAPKITTHTITFENGKKKKVSMDMAVGYIGLTHLENWKVYLEMLVESTFKGSSSKIINYENYKTGKKEKFKLDMITQFPKK